jgi:steroid Delta-isomerase
MVKRAMIQKAIEEYCRAESSKDKTAWLALFSEVVRHEDPVGTHVNIGMEKLAAFWDTFQSLDVELSLTEPLIICGNEAIAHVSARLGPPGNRREMPRIIDHFVFDENGKITSVRAFFEVS